MTKWGWIAIGVVVFALVLLVVIGLGTFRRLRTLETATAMPELNEDIAALQSRVAALQEAAQDMQQRVQTTQERMESVRAARNAD